MHDVIVVGAGPVGLFLACELRLGGATVLVLEREANPASPLKRLPFGMRGLTVPSAEAFYRRGLLDAIAPPSPKRQAGHFAGIPFDPNRIDTSKWPYRLPSPADTNLAAEQGHIEDVLAERALALGVEIRRGVAVDGFEETASEVAVQEHRGRWLVGCDGGRSMIRKAGGFEFEGTDPYFTGYSFQVDLANPGVIPLGRHLTKGGMYFQTQPGHFGLVEFDGGASHRTSLSLEHVQAMLRRVSGTDVALTKVHVATTWTDRAQQATEYRRRRVFLAGDAAHIHSPLGGQGLNTGLGDAMNLGWKLASAVRGDAPEGLLDSYHAERHPVGAAVLDWSRAQVALMRPDPSARALERIVRDVIDTKDGNTYFVERVWGVSLRYDLGDPHPLVGRSAPDFESNDGVKLGELLRAGRGAMLDFGTSDSLRAVADACGVPYVAAKSVFGLGAALVRPDGVVAWACDLTLGFSLSEECIRAARERCGRMGTSTTRGA